jgi:hypothetical protein
MPSRDPAGSAFLKQLREVIAGGDRPLHGLDDVEREVAEAVEQILPFVLEAEAIEDAPLAAALTLGRPEAKLIPVPESNRSVVVVERELPTLANLVAKALAAALPTREDGERLQLHLDDETWEATLSSGHPAVQRFVEAMVATQHEGPASAQVYDGDPELEPVVSTVRQVIEWFEVAQPYAHVAAGHHDVAARQPWLESLGSFEQFEWTAEQDHEAVARASMAVLNRARQAFGDVRMAAWALDAWMTTQMLVAGGAAVVQALGQDVFDTLISIHAERRALYRAILEQDEELRPSLALVALLEPMMAQFWEHSVQALMAEDE